MQSICVALLVLRGNYLGGEPIRRTEVEARVSKLKKRMAAGVFEVRGEIIKSGGDMVVDWTGFRGHITESGIVPEDMRSAVIVPQYKGRGEQE